MHMLRVPRRMSHGAPTSPGRPIAPRTTDDEEEYSPGHLVKILIHDGQIKLTYATFEFYASDTIDSIISLEYSFHIHINIK